MPRTLIRTFVGTVALLIGSAQALAFAQNSENDFRCVASNGLSLHIPSGHGRFMQDIVIQRSSELLGDLVDKRAATTSEEKLRLAYGFTSSCAPTNGDSILCEDYSLANASYSFYDEAANESLRVGKQLDVRESKFELSKDSNGIFHVKFTIETYALAGRVRSLEITQELGPAVTFIPDTWNPGCTSLPPQL